MAIQSKILKPLILTSGLVTLGNAPAVMAENEPKGTETAAMQVSSAVHEAWLLGKVETSLLLNRHLNSFFIDTHVSGHTAVLHGTVDSSIDRELAREVALSVDGIDKVINKLEIDMEGIQSTTKSSKPTLEQRVNDATITAAVKARLVANGHVSGMDIDVDTSDAMVTLQGAVDSDKERDLAGLIARNTSSVADVNNQLKITN